MVDAIVPKNKEYAKFQFQVYRRVKKYREGKNVKSNPLEYAPHLRKQDGESYRPDIVWDISRALDELYFPGVTLTYNWQKIFNDGAISDMYDSLIQKQKDIVIRLILDATIHDFKDDDQWKKRIDRMEKYAEVSIKNDGVDFAIPVLVSRKGYDGSLDYGVERTVHVIHFHYIESFLDDILRLTLHYDLTKTLEESLFAKQNSCDKCGSEDLHYIPIYYCPEYGDLTVDVLEEWSIYDIDDRKPIDEIVLCDGCSYQGMCEGFNRSFSVVCSKCGKIKSGGKLHPCALVKLNDWFDECNSCSDPDDCKVYDDLVNKKILMK